MVVATGGYRVPVIPDFAEAIDPSVRQLHSSTYRRPGQLQPGNVLVVGLGNSGAEIALDVSRTHRTWVAGTPSAEMPFRLGGRSGRLALPVVRVVGMHVLTRGNPIGRAAIPRLEAHAVPLIRTKRRDLIAAGVRRVGRVIGVEDGRPITDGGDRPLDVSNIIWCTGFRDDFRWIDLPVFGDRRAGAAPPRSRRVAAGAVLPRPGVPVRRGVGHTSGCGSGRPSSRTADRAGRCNGCSCS